jgi:hypothetical protein
MEMDKKLLRVGETPTVAIPLKHAGDEPLFCIGKFAIAEYSDGSIHKVLTQQDSGVMTEGGIFIEVGSDYVSLPEDEIRRISWYSPDNFAVSEKIFKRVSFVNSTP